MQTRRVGTEIPLDQHIHITSLAKTHGTTVGELLKYGLVLVSRKLKATPRAGKKLARDHRLSR